MSILATATRERLGEHRRDLARRLPDALHARLPARAGDIVVTRRVQGYLDFLAPHFPSEQAQIARDHGAAACDDFNRIVLIDLLLAFDPAPLLPDRAPAWLRQDYARRVEFVAGQVLGAPSGTYDAMSETLVKELRLLGGVSFPVLDSLADWQAYLPPTFYRYRGWRRNLAAFGYIWLKAGGLGPYVRMHVDTRFVEQRRQVGHVGRRHKVAEVLIACPGLRGQVSTSWLHDPVLKDISPHMWDNTAHALNNGAYLRRDGYNELDVERATATSKTRRRLYEAGEYRPCCYTYVWARRDMIAWHRRTVGRDGSEP